MKHAPWNADGENNQKLLQLLTLGDSYDQRVIIPWGDSDSHRPDDPSCQSYFSFVFHTAGLASLQPREEKEIVKQKEAVRKPKEEKDTWEKETSRVRPSGWAGGSLQSKSGPGHGTYSRGCPAHQGHADGQSWKGWAAEHVRRCEEGGRQQGPRDGGLQKEVPRANRRDGILQKEVRGAACYSQSLGKELNVFFWGDRISASCGRPRQRTDKHVVMSLSIWGSFAASPVSFQEAASARAELNVSNLVNLVVNQLSRHIKQCRCPGRSWRQGSQPEHEVMK